MKKIKNLFLKKKKKWQITFFLMIFIFYSSCVKLSFWNCLLETAVIIYIYMFIYNISLMVFFWNFHQFLSYLFKTIHSFSNFKFSFFFLTSFTITLFSMAGVPPFSGFFSKLLIIVALSNSNFTIFYLFFFALLFLGLYFYIQNVRFLHASRTSNLTPSSDRVVRVSAMYFLFLFLFLFFLAFGAVFLDDFLCYFFWLFK